MMDLVQLWMALVGLVVILYVILDGFGLGIGLLFPTADNEEERDTLMNSIAPIWDANQTWIVFGGGALFAAFPRIYTVLFSALYIPLLTFLFGLIFRGVAFEFRANTRHKKPWNRAFFIGSLVAVLGQGFTLGGYISGIRVVDGAFAGGPFDWLNPFTLIVGLALVVGYMLLGATFLIIKTEGCSAGKSLPSGVFGRFCHGRLHAAGERLDALPRAESDCAVVYGAADLFRMEFSPAGDDCLRHAAVEPEEKERAHAVHQQCSPVYLRIPGPRGGPSIPWRFRRVSPFTRPPPSGKPRCSPYGGLPWCFRWFWDILSTATGYSVERSRMPKGTTKIAGSGLCMVLHAIRYRHSACFSIKALITRKDGGWKIPDRP